MAARVNHMASHITSTPVEEQLPISQKTAIQSKIEEVIALNPVVVISKSTCPFCVKAKTALKEAGFTRASIVELDNLGDSVAAEVQDYMLQLTGARTVPRVFIQQKFVGGGTAVVDLAEKGKLKELIDQAVIAHKRDLKGDGDFSIAKTEEEWKASLGSNYRILRQRGTEPPSSHEYDQFYPEKGHFACAGCALPLYSASSKFQSSCGWPVFDKCYQSKDVGCHIATRPDGGGALEILCPRCGSHMGHVFFDAHTETNLNGERH